MFFYKNQTDDLFKLETKLLISCPNNQNSLGGLFILDFKKNKIKKILEGDIRGFSIYRDKLYISNEAKGIEIYDQKFNLINILLIKNADIHGILAKNNLLYVSETATDTINIYDITTFKKIKSINISDSRNDSHHINDTFLKNNHLYISMFSISGTWKQKEENFDGVIVNYDLKTNKYKIIKKNLQHPHSIVYIKNKLYFCESLNLNLSILNKTLAIFGGYTRGLYFDNKYCYIGQSEMRHLDRILSKVPNISLDCGVYIFNPKKHTNRFVPLPAKQIYQIGSIENFSFNYDTKIDFNSNTAIKNLKNINNWYYPDGKYRWMAKKTATIYLNKSKKHKYLISKIYNGFPEKYSASIIINSSQIHKIVFNSPSEKTFKFDISKVTNDILNIQIKVTNLWTPSKYLQTKDNRQLGLAIKKIFLK